MQSPSERRRPPIKLTVAAVHSAPDEIVGGPVLPGAVAGLLAGAAAAVTGWLAVTGFVLIVWLGVTALPLATVLGFSSQFWLSAHGAGALVGQLPVTLTPLALTFALVWIVRVLVGTAIRHVTAADSPEDTPQRIVAWRTAGLAVGAYALVAGFAAIASGSGSRVGWALGGAVVLAGAGALWAVGRTAGLGLSERLPRWARRLPVALGAGLAALAAGASAVLVTGLVAGADRVGAIESSLRADVIGQVALVLLTLAYLPNLLVWAASYALGAGFGLGAGTIVSPAIVQVGLLPAIPVLGALPPSGPGNPWSYAWLALGVLAGAAAGVAQVRRLGRTTLPARLGQAALAGLLTAATVLALAVVSRGDLGIVRLVGLGPDLLDLSWLAPASLVVGATVAALVHWFVGGRHEPPAAEDAETVVVAVGEQETVPLGR